MKVRLRFLLFLALTVIPRLGFAADCPILVHWQLENEGLYVYRFDMDTLNWRQIRKEREQRNTVWEAYKRIALRKGSLSQPFGELVAAADWTGCGGDILIRDPDGNIATVPIKIGAPPMPQIPDNLRLNGRYLVGGHFLLGDWYADGDGRKETLHLYSKLMTGHYGHDGRPGASPAFFFNDSRMVLEIGSALSPAQHRMGGGFQRPHEEYDMEVRYHNRPLPGATVEVIAEGSGWRKSYHTDGAGRFTVIPFDDRSRQRHYEKLLYVVKVEDPDNRALHVATLPMIIFRNRPEWTSHAAGYALWAGLGLGGGLLLAAGSMVRGRRQRRLSLVRFDQCRVKED